jgi:hypothetical protein
MLLGVVCLCQYFPDANLPRLHTFMIVTEHRTLYVRGPGLKLCSRDCLLWQVLRGCGYPRALQRDASVLPYVRPCPFGTAMTVTFFPL